MTSSSTKVFGILALLTAILLQVANLYFGELNQDEGWYLYAAQQVTEGKLPYRDYAYTQAPLLPLVYSLTAPIVREWGVGGGRAVTAVLGLVAAFLASSIARRLVKGEGSDVAGVIAFTLCAVNVYQSYFTTVVKTYSLCACFLTAGVLALVTARGTLRYCLAGTLLVLAGATRISAGVAVPIVAIYLVATDGWRLKARTWGFVTGACACAALVFGPLYVMAPEGFLFGVLEYHAGREAGGLLQTMVFKAGFVSRVVQAYFLTFTFLVFFTITRLMKGREEGSPAVTIIWLVVATITLVHFVAPFPYDDYQVVVYPLACAAVAATLAAHISAADKTGKRAVVAMAGLWVLATASSFSSPINQDWMIAGRDRIWWRMKEKPALAQLQDVGAWLRERTKPGDLLLTQDTYIAVEAGLRVPAGLEMGPFSYFPSLSDERAAALKVLNEASMRSLLEATPAQYAALSGYALSLSSPEVSEVPESDRAALREIVDRRFEVGRIVPRFGQAQTTLELLRARGQAVAP